MLPPRLAARNKQDGQDEQDGLLHEPITRKIIGVCFDVMGELGAGFLESVYHNALRLALCDAGLHVQSDIPIEVHFRGLRVGVFRADLLVDDKVLIEVKAVSALTPEHQAQVINYLKATRIDVGLLVNFGRPRLELKRLHP